MINHLLSQRYEVLEKTSEGTVFTVYKARDKAANRVVSLKTTLPGYAADAPFMAGLRLGIAAAVKLSHPSIAATYEDGTDEDAYYVTGEFVRGINLKERIKRIAPFTLSVAVDIACAVTEALQSAHGLGQVHGDLCPQNIIISPEGAVKVTDFGVMQGVARSAAAQRDTLLRAAPYHAPELSIASPGSVPGDIYALGAVLFEMLTGTTLYAGDDPEAIADLHAFAPIPTPRAINPGVPRSIEGIVVKCLQKRPEQRYTSASELLNDLKSVRDALRFGKPLSWSPIDLDKAGTTATAPRAAASAAITSAVSVPAARPLEPVAEAAASSQAMPMPVSNRLRARDERVSISLKIAIGVVSSIILACLIGIAAIYGEKWVEPNVVTIPQFVGKPIEVVRVDAKKLNVKLREHDEFSDKPRNIVFRSDQPQGVQLHEGHTVNVWYSKGSTYVDVPRVTGITRDDAEKRLKEAGLTSGKITPEYSLTVPQNVVISQNVSYKKRVLHDTAVDLVFSDGPKPDYASDQTADPSNPNVDPNKAADAALNGANENANGSDSTVIPPDSGTAALPPDGAKTGTDANPATQPTATDLTERQFNRRISIPKDGKGERLVDVEFTDATTETKGVISETHPEGDKIHVRFSYKGKSIRLRMYYTFGEPGTNNLRQLCFDKTFDPEATKGERIR